MSNLVATPGNLATRSTSPPASGVASPSETSPKKIQLFPDHYYDAPPTLIWPKGKRHIPADSTSPLKSYKVLMCPIDCTPGPRTVTYTYPDKTAFPGPFVPSNIRTTAHYYAPLAPIDEMPPLVPEDNFPYSPHTNAMLAKFYMAMAEISRDCSHPLMKDSQHVLENSIKDILDRVDEMKRYERAA